MNTCLCGHGDREHTDGLGRCQAKVFHCYRCDYERCECNEYRVSLEVAA